MPGNTSHTFFDQLVEAIEQAQKEAQATQRASQADVEKARREMAREKMEKERAEKAAKEKAAKAAKEKAGKEKAKKDAAKEGTADTGTEGSKPLLGEKFDARKMVIYSEIMNPKYKE